MIIIFTLSKEPRPLHPCAKGLGRMFSVRSEFRMIDRSAIVAHLVHAQSTQNTDDA